MEIKVYEEDFDSNYPFWDGSFDKEDYSGRTDTSYVEIYIDLEDEKCFVRPSGANPPKRAWYSQSEFNGEAITFTPRIVFLDKSDVETLRSELDKWCDLFAEEYNKNGEVSFETIHDFEKDYETWGQYSAENEAKLFEEAIEEVAEKVSDEDLDKLAKEVIEAIGEDADLYDCEKMFSEKLEFLMDEKSILNSAIFAEMVMRDEWKKIDELLKKHHDEMFPEEDD